MSQGICHEELRAMGATCRKKVGNTRPLVLRWLTENFAPGRLKILDYGCGSTATQVRELRELGYNITGHEWSPPPGDTSKRAQHYTASVREGFISESALSEPGLYDFVLLSNVLNIQASENSTRCTLQESKDAMNPNGILVANLPATPRTIWSTGKKGWGELQTILEKNFMSVKIRPVQGSKEHIFICTLSLEATQESLVDYL